MREEERQSLSTTVRLGYVAYTVIYCTLHSTVDCQKISSKHSVIEMVAILFSVEDLYSVCVCVCVCVCGLKL